MRKIVLVLLLGMLFIAGQVWALSWTSVSNTTVQQTAVNSPSYIHRVTISNSGTNPCTVAFADNTTSKGYVVIGAKDSKQFELKCRIATNFKITMSNTTTFVGVEYVAGTAYGFYWYAVSDTTTSTNVYNSFGDLLGVIVANANTDTGHSSAVSDSTTLKLRVHAPASSTKRYDIEALRIQTAFVIQNDMDNMSCIVIRKQ